MLQAEGIGFGGKPVDQLAIVSAASARIRLFDPAASDAINSSLVGGPVYEPDRLRGVESMDGPERKAYYELIQDKPVKTVADKKLAKGKDVPITGELLTHEDLAERRTILYNVIESAQSVWTSVPTWVKLAVIAIPVIPLVMYLAQGKRGGRRKGA